MSLDDVGEVKLRFLLTGVTRYQSILLVWFLDIVSQPVRMDVNMLKCSLNGVMPELASTFELAVT